MTKVYPAVIHLEDGMFWVEFPDLPGCQSTSDTLEGIISNASEALGLYLAELINDGNPFPAPSDIKEMPQGDNSFASYVPCDVSKYINKNKSVKKTLTIPQWLNEEAEKANINFSSVLQTALIEKLNV